jgi:hypothetical protein
MQQAPTGKCSLAALFNKFSVQNVGTTWCTLVDACWFYDQKFMITFLLKNLWLGGGIKKRTYEY